MEGLFFVIDQIWILYPTIMGYFILSILLWYVYYLLYAKKDNTYILQNPTYITYNPIHPNDILFIEKTLFEIRNYISKKYLPKHTWAHTPKEITEYITNISIIHIIKNLEHKEYLWLPISMEEATDINNQLIQILQ